jgi:hypothetical protein
MKVYLTIYLMILIMHYKYFYILVYIWSEFKTFDFSGNENNIYFGTEGVSTMQVRKFQTSSIAGYLVACMMLEDPSTLIECVGNCF